MKAHHGIFITIVAVVAQIHAASINPAGVSANDRISTRAGPQFSGPEFRGIVWDPRILEASGLAASRKHPGLAYTLNDHGGKNEVYAINITSGATMATYTITGATNVDWEDIAVGVCHGTQCIYVGDTGDSGPAQIIYRIIEPDTITDHHVGLDGELKYRWDEDDTETVMVDPNGEVYIVSKVHTHHHPKIAKLPSTAWNAGHRASVEHDVSVPITSDHNDPMAGDISPDGTEVLLKTNKHVYYWKVHNNDYMSALSTHPIEVPYMQEPQGESVCWDATGSGYYTLSEGFDQRIHYYRRNNEHVVGR